MVDRLKPPRDRQVRVQKTPEAPMLNKCVVERWERKRSQLCVHSEERRKWRMRVVRTSLL